LPNRGTNRNLRGLGLLLLLALVPHWLPKSKLSHRQQKINFKFVINTVLDPLLCLYSIGLIDPTPAALTTTSGTTG
jgi:hypothetical protein